MTEQVAREQVIDAGKRLVQSGLIARTWGNVSCRLDSNYFIITPSGRDYLGLKPEDLVKVSIKDCSYSGDIKPSSEKGIHADLYQQRPDMNFVIHTHQKEASIVGTLNMDYVELSNKLEHLEMLIPCAKYGLPGTKKLRRHVKQAVQSTNGNCVLMKNHGALCYGRTIDESFQTAIELEEGCKLAMKEAFMQLVNAKDFSLEEFLLFSCARIGHREISVSHSDNDLMDFRIPGVETRLLSDSMYQKYAKTGETLFPYLDDFAQIVGTRVKNTGSSYQKIIKEIKKSNAVFIPNKGVLLVGSTKEDLDAIQMILEKNCIAHLAGTVYGTIQPIGWLDRKLMRFVYLKKYSKKIKEN